MIFIYSDIMQYINLMKILKFSMNRYCTRLSTQNIHIHIHKYGFSGQSVKDENSELKKRLRKVSICQGIMLDTLNVSQCHQGRSQGQGHLVIVRESLDTIDH